MKKRRELLQRPLEFRLFQDIHHFAADSLYFIFAGFMDIFGRKVCSGMLVYAMGIIGLAVGELVVSEGAERLREGAKIEVKGQNRGEGGGGSQRRGG